MRQAVAGVSGGVPEESWVAIQRNWFPFAINDVEVFIWVGGVFSGTWEFAFACAGVFLEVVSRVASCWRALAGTVTCVPVEAWCTSSIQVLAFALAFASVPVVGGWALLLEAVAAAGVDVPVEAIFALLDHATALAVLTVLVLEPVLSGFALLGSAFTSAGVGVPVLASSTFCRWFAEASAAFVVPEVVGAAISRVSADAFAESIIEELRSSVA